MTAQHRLDLFGAGTLTGARVVCLGTDADICRQWCTEESCEEGCYGEPILWPWPEGLPVAQAPLDGHRYKPYEGGCRIAEWLNAGDLDETCADEDRLRFCADGCCQPGIRSGLIDVTWDGDDYLWEWVDEDRGRPGPVPVCIGQLPIDDVRLASVPPCPGQLTLDEATA